MWYHFVMIEIRKWTSAFGGSPFYIHIFAENISQAKPTSHATRRISQICKANLLHCGLGISLCPTHEWVRLFYMVKEPLTLRFCRGGAATRPPKKEVFRIFRRSITVSFALRRLILLRQNQRAGQCPAPTGLFTKQRLRKAPFIRLPLDKILNKFII